MVEALIACFASHGYDRVKPPLVEFEDSLFAGPGAAMTDNTFRLMDPLSQRMMGLRADTTVQIARIAATRLSITRGLFGSAMRARCSASPGVSSTRNASWSR